jgi:FkbM family methyltransferase
MGKSINISPSNLDNLIDKILDEEVDDARERERTTFDKKTQSHSKSLVLFGAGGLGRKTLSGLRLIGIEPFAFTDNNPDLWGRTVDGLKVFSPESAAEIWKDSAAFIVTIWRHGAKEPMGARIGQLRNLGCQIVEPVIYLFWKYPQFFLPYYLMDLPSRLIMQKDEIKEAFSLFNDDSSRFEFFAQVKLRSFGVFEDLPDPVQHETFFPVDLWRDSFSETFIDCGAFTGDTLKPFLASYEKKYSSYVAIEPDPGSFAQLVGFIRSLPDYQKEKIIPYELAIGSDNGKVYFDAQGTASSSIGQGTQLVDCIRLDDLLGDRKPTMIKMDIEGEELNALLGARNTMARNHPMLAISAYHCQNHLWQIPRLIKSVSDHYTFYLRPHQLDGWDLVCYAIPE